MKLRVHFQSLVLNLVVVIRKISVRTEYGRDRENVAVDEHVRGFRKSAWAFLKVKLVVAIQRGKRRCLQSLY